MTTQTPESFIPPDTLANRLVLIRKELGLSQREAAMRCGVGFGSWQSWEKGSAPRHALRDLTMVARVLGVDRDWLLFGGSLAAEEWPAASEPTSRHKRPHYQHQLTDSDDSPPSTAEVQSFLKSTPLVREAAKSPRSAVAS